MLRLEEPPIGILLEETQLVIISRKIRQLSGRHLVLYLIQNLKVRRMNNKN